LTRRRRAALLIALIVPAGLLASSPELHRRLVALIGFAEPTIVAHPVWGAVVFTALSALGAILLFVSSWVLVPIGVQVWGPVGCFLLLWTGWFLGGAMTYSIGRYLGRPAVQRLVPADVVARYEGRIPSGGRFLPALVVTISVPSDIAGYFFGLFRYPMRVYLAALGVSEVPYALGAVFLGEAFIQRRFSALLAVSCLAALGLLRIWLHRRGERRAD
jgi:uncharacterized membrane protein YdjX (TVP38/TMEM64 family)